jgi:hypothetical protein
MISWRDGGADDGAAAGTGLDRVKLGAGGSGLDRIPLGNPEGVAGAGRTGCTLGGGAGGMGLGAVLTSGDIEIGTE